MNRTIWTKANDLLKGRSGGTEIVKRNRHGAILQGLLKCATYGSSMVPAYTTRGSHRYRYYGCRKAQNQCVKACPRQMVAAERIERAVVGKLYELIAKEDWQRRPSDHGLTHFGHSRTVVVSLVPRLG